MNQLPVFVVFSLLVSECYGGCAEVDSETEAVAGVGFLLGCISCKTREEVPARATVDWHFKPAGEEKFRHIFHYDHPNATVFHPDFRDRLEWHGTLNPDVQTGAVYLQNVTFNDTGTYRCTFRRTLLLSLSHQLVIVEKEVELTVVAEGEAACCSYAQVLILPPSTEVCSHKCFCLKNLRHTENCSTARQTELFILNKKAAPALRSGQKSDT
uniref:Sodium channel regulatory subunit beta-3 n=1 Tax=Oryzias sinensis TaxID=183150 RepID=A0A8C7WYJ0_9TELE